MDQTLIGIGGALALLFLGFIRVIWNWAKGMYKLPQQMKQQDKTVSSLEDKISNLEVANDLLASEIREANEERRYLKTENQTLILNAGRQNDMFDKHVQKLVEVEKRISELLAKLERIEADYAYAQVQIAIKDDKIEALESQLSENEKERYRLEGRKNQLWEIFQTFGIRVTMITPDPLAPIDPPPGGGDGGGKDEKVIPLTDAVSDKRIETEEQDQLKKAS